MSVMSEAGSQQSHEKQGQEAATETTECANQKSSPPPSQSPDSNKKNDTFKAQSAEDMKPTRDGEEIIVDCKAEEKKAEIPSIPTMPTLSTPLKRSAACLSSYTLSPTASKKSSDEAEEDDDDDDEEKLSSSGNDIDPERLKAFNMFCRLFVDENLDRLVPISKQPKDKVQAILDACDRQFPEFHDRARKRIRTYLKSCRRMRRAREMNGWDNFRPTPPHLTSPIAESLLSQACENETQNAKRMRIGLEPIAVAPPTKPLSNNHNVTNAQHTSHKAHVSSAAAVSAASMPSLIPSSLAAVQAAASNPASHRMFPDWRFQHAPPFRPELAPFFSNGFLRPPFPGFPTPLPAAAALQASQVANQLAMQQTQGSAANEINMKKNPATTNPATSKSSSLTATEISTIRQLISGYRESATFLYRSADELEQLISHAN